MADISDIVSRASENGLTAQRRLVDIDATVFEDAYVVRAAVRLDEVISHQEDVVVVDIDGSTLLAGTALRTSVGVDADTVMVIGNVIVANHMSLTLYLDGVVGGDGRGIFKPGPAMDPSAVMHADYGIVRDIKIVRTSPVGHYALAYLVHFAIHD